MTQKLDDIEVPGWEEFARAGQIRDPEPWHLEPMFLAIDDAIRGDTDDLATQRRRRRRFQRIGGIAAAAAVATVAALVAPTLGWPGDEPAASAEAAAILTAAADRIDAHAGLTTTDGSYVYKVTQSTHVVDGELGPFLETSKSEEWTPKDAAGLTYSRYTYLGSVDMTGNPDRSAAAGRSAVESFTQQQISDQHDVDHPGWQTPTPEWLASLPRDTDQLRELIYYASSGKGSGPDAEAAVHIGDVLRTGEVPADLRAALFRVLATIPGVTVQNEDVTVDGRRATAISYTEASNGEREELLVGPDDGAFLGWRTVATRDSRVPAGTAQTSVVVTETVSHVPAGVVKAARPSTETCHPNGDGGVLCQG